MLEAGENIWTRSSIADFAPRDEPEEPAGPMNALEALRLARKALEAARAHKALNPRDSVTVRDMVMWLVRHIHETIGPTDALALLETQPDSDHRSALFLAMLELTKQSRIRLQQAECFGPISLTQLLSTGSRMTI
jgi:chromatin segregation and condensation protein Rec8/ScpA/Scc1 (kleisin family)